MRHLSVITTAVMLFATSATGCASETSGSDAFGSVEVNLIVDNTDVKAVSFDVICDSGITLGGQLNVNDEVDPPVATTIMDLLPGDCSITLTAFDNAGDPLCTGSEDFTVLANDTVQVNVVLVCGSDGEELLGNAYITATFVEGNNCPRLHFFNAVPNNVPPEGSEVTVLVSDKDGDALTTALTATGGSFVDPSARSTTYTCDGANGAQTISVTVSDGVAECDKSKSFPVTCPSGETELRPLPEIYTTGTAINYSAFRAGGPDVGEIPSDADILEDLGLLQTAGYNLLRLFGADPVSEKILQLAAANFPEMRFQQGLFLEGLAPGPPADNCQSVINDSQVATAIQFANTYSSVVTVSVGNETSFFSAFMPLNCLEGYITETRNNVTQPVTADDDYTFYAGTFARKPDTVLPLIDFVSIHTYPFLNDEQWDWRQVGVTAGPPRAEAMMNASLVKAQDNYQAVYDYRYVDASGRSVTIGESLPIVIGETGWKWRQTNFSAFQEIETYAANPVNAKWYYDLMLTWEGSPGGPPTIFIFEAFDEAWKLTDDGWGFWDEDRMPNYALCGTPAGTACNNPVYQGAGFFTP